MTPRRQTQPRNPVYNTEHCKVIILGKYGYWKSNIMKQWKWELRMYVNEIDRINHINPHQKHHAVTD